MKGWNPLVDIVCTNYLNPFSQPRIYFITFFEQKLLRGQVNLESLRGNEIKEMKSLQKIMVGISFENFSRPSVLGRAPNKDDLKPAPQQ